ncbi:ligand-binding protein SH3 [Pseudomonas fragi]|nr:ligand-binding protein SH3 [Pseudomonas fragi]MBM1204905.1 ligand-binding protein SH3 [Pseudomonas fragi]NMY57985.1 ligand-binding protein SH3 [Pseudomonas sp. WS 5051]
MTLKAGDRVSVGEQYDGPEGWDKWFLCSAPGQKAGWVPGQIIDSGVVTQDYTARELEVVIGDRLIGTRQLNGWLWATRIADGVSGWVPLNKIRIADAL